DLHVRVVGAFRDPQRDVLVLLALGHGGRVDRRQPAVVRLRTGEADDDFLAGVVVLADRPRAGVGLLRGRIVAGTGGGEHGEGCHGAGGTKESAAAVPHGSLLGGECSDGFRVGSRAVHGGEPLRAATRCCSSTATTMIAPFATAWVDVSRLLSVKTLVSVVKISTPKTVPTIVPRPPESSVPPMTTAAMASSSMSVPCVDVPAVVRASSITAASPHATPTRTYSSVVCRLTLMPASLAASGLP